MNSVSEIETKNTTEKKNYAQVGQKGAMKKGFVI